MENKSKKLSKKDPKPPKTSSLSQNLAKELEEYSLKPNSFNIQGFYLGRRIPKRSFYNEVERSEILQDALVFAKEQVGINREKLVLEHNLSINSGAAFVLPRFLDYWAEEVKSRALLKDENKVGTATVIIELPKAEKTNVPEKT